MDISALNNISCGLFVLTAKDGDKQNGCIINTVMQVTATPVKISVTVAKTNHTTDMIKNTGEFVVSCIDETAKFSLFERFGFASGKDVNKFDGFSGYKTTPNGINCITESTNAYICAKVIETVDVGTHYMFIAEVTDAEVLSDKASATYAYYHANIKPKPQVKPSEKTRWVCKICGYIYEGEELPEDYVCPLCNHPASDFEKV